MPRCGRGDQPQPETLRLVPSITVLTMPMNAAEPEHATGETMSTLPYPGEAACTIRAITSLGGADARSVAGMIDAYLRHTEAEKAAHGLTSYAPGDPLPAAYAEEVRRPEQAFAGATVLLASRAGRDVGVAVLRPLSDGAEIKRLWVDPVARGTGAGRALLQEIVRREPSYLRLSVWSWRNVAIRAYERSGFTVVPGWDNREDLVCMERRSASAPASDPALTRSPPRTRSS